MSDDWAQFAKKDALYHSLGGKLPMDARRVPSKIADMDGDLGIHGLKVLAVSRLAECGLPAHPDLIGHMSAALAIKGGCIIYRFRNETVVGNIERL